MRIIDEASWEQHVFRAPGPGPGEEGQQLDLKGDLNAPEKIALKVGGLANAEGGVVAFGAAEGMINGREIAISTSDTGDPQTGRATIEQAIGTYLRNLEPPPLVISIHLKNGHRVIAVNVDACVRLVGFWTSREAEKVRYPVRRGEILSYYRPEDVERHILSYAARGARFRLEDLLRRLGHQLPAPVVVHHLGLVTGQELRYWNDDVWIKELLRDGLKLSFARQYTGPVSLPHFDFVVPWEWVLSQWEVTRVNTNAVRYSRAAILVGALLQWRGNVLDAVPVPWKR
jgi:hypothetical protein